MTSRKAQVRVEDIILSTSAKEKNGYHLGYCPAHDDDSYSLSIRRKSHQHGEAITLKCFAGCDTEDICGRLGIEAYQLFPADPEWGSDKPYIAPKITKKAKEEKVIKYKIRDKIVKDKSKVKMEPCPPFKKYETASYPYENEGGEIGFVMKRFECEGYKKSFVTYHADGKTPGMPEGQERVIYHLPKVKEAIKKGEWIVLTEGEKDVANTEKTFGIVATTHSNGSGSWLPEYADQLSGAKVIISPDRDGAGEVWINKVIEDLEGKAEEVKLLDLPGDCKDISDWIESGATKEQFHTLINDTHTIFNMPKTPETPKEETAPKAKKEKEFSPPPKLRRERFTDSGNAARFAYEHSTEARYNLDKDRWAVWNGKVWDMENEGLVIKKAKETAENMILDGEKTGNADLMKHGIKTEGARSLNNMVSLAQSEDGIPIKHSEFDNHRFYLTVNNGTIDLRNGTVMPHNKDHMFTRALSVNYNPEAKCPNWEKFVLEIMSGDEEMVKYLQRVVGYCLTGDGSERCFWVFHGGGNNGKSVFAEVISKMLGTYAIHSPFDTFLAKKHSDGVPNAVAGLAGSRFVTASETEKGRKLASALLKNLSGNEVVSARFLFKEFFEFLPTFKMFLLTNPLPKLDVNDQAVWNRLKAVRFGEKFTGARVDLKLKTDKLLPELEGILNWAIEGCKEWMEQGLNHPEKVAEATELYKKELDPFGRFVDECCDIGKDKVCKTKDLFEAYDSWRRDNGEIEMSVSAIGNACKAKGYEKKVSRTANFRMGLTLKADCEYGHNSHEW